MLLANDNEECYESGPAVDHESEGCIRMWVAVVMQALEDAGPGGYVKPQKVVPRQRQRSYAVAWLRSDSEAEGSLRWIARLIGCDAGQVQRGIVGEVAHWYPEGIELRTKLRSRREPNQT